MCNTEIPESLSINNRKIVPAGGILGYLKTRSAPSLIAGVGLGLSYGYAGEC